MRVPGRSKSGAGKRPKEHASALEAIIAVVALPARLLEVTAPMSELEAGDVEWKKDDIRSKTDDIRLRTVTSDRE
jgi:hypothetical protein